MVDVSQASCQQLLEFYRLMCCRHPSVVIHNL